MKIRQSHDKDMEEIYQLVKEAFLTAEESDGNEHELVLALTKGDAFVPQLSLVAENKGQLVGYILFTEIQIGDAIGLALAPLAVRKDWRFKGVGGQLIQEGHRIAKELGYKVSVVLGSDAYYRRFAYQVASRFGILAPFEVEDRFFRVYALGDISDIQGTVSYAPEFGI